MNDFEEQLRRKTEELDMVVSSLDDIVLQYDEQGRFIRQWCRDENLIRVLPRTYLGRSLKEAHDMDPEFAAPFIADFENALKKNEIYYRDFMIDDLEVTKWFNSKISPLYNADGSRKGCTQRITDISEKKKVELAIAEKNNELQAIHREYSEIVEHATEVIFKLTSEGYFFFVSAEFERLLGYTNAQIKGKHFSTIVHPEDLPLCMETFGVLTREGKAENNITFRVRDVDGNYVYIDCSAVCLFNQEGLPTHIIGFAHDITIQKNTEKALRISEERYRSLFDSLGEGITLLDNSGSIIASNRAAESIFSISKEQLMGYRATKPNQYFLHEDGTPFPPDTHPSAVSLRTGQSFKNIVMGVGLGEQPVRWISITTESIYYSDNRSKPDAVVVSFTDITDRRRQDRLLALEKEVLEINAEPSSSLNTIVDYFIKGLEQIFPGAACSVLTLHPGGKRMMHMSSPSLPEALTSVIDGSEIGPGVGSCGAAMFHKKRIITKDIFSDPLWMNYRSVASQFGLRACWSFPIINAKNEVLATIAAYYKVIASPTESELDIFERVSNLLKIIIENKKAEAAVRLSNERYLLATKATNDALWDLDMTSNILYWGDGFFNLCGYRPGEIDNSTRFWESCIHPDDRDRVLASLQTFIDSGSSGIWQEEYQFRNAQGIYLLVLDRAFLLFNQDGKINRMVGSMQDITEKKELERKLLQQELARQKLVAQAVVDAQEKERAEIGNELHDNVNQILSTARLYLELARNDETERINLINRSVNNIAAAVDEIRKISRSLVPASISDLGLVVSIQDLVENIQFTKTLNVEFYYQGEIEKIIVDKRKLMLFRIIQEQVTNVLKHAEARNLIIELIVDEHYISLSISDDGKGFDKEKIKTKKGVGLYNIESRTELFNGTMNMVTEPGKGCKLNIHIPV